MGLFVFILLHFIIFVMSRIASNDL